ncbi:Pro-Pol polyprotein [Smittium culicis]|uniref:Pro-Pol polyprotein n=1 Tax=Smittium culicis TaxID=133412 RepID=A0A1R1YQR8_9FUNG|nr:Pro-Pol polyprotein [Smittium culicis]
MSCFECQSFMLTKPGYRFNGKSGISGLFNKWFLDYLGPLTCSKDGNMYVLVAVEQLSGYPVAWSVADQTAITTCRCLMHLFSTFGIPKQIVTDKGGVFNSKMMHDLCTLRGSEFVVNVAYQPEWMGIVEKMNAVIRYSITKSSHYDMKLWDRNLDSVLMGIRFRVSARTGYSPYYVLFGVDPNLPIDYGKPVPVNLATREIELKSLPTLRNGLLQDRKSSTVVPKFEVGTLVMLLSYTLRKKSSRSKTAPRYLGPYQIKKLLGYNLYEITSEKGKKLTVHVSRLVQYVQRIGEDFYLTRGVLDKLN